ncbi:dTDP-4-dehydrorhamnose 3,5-epimerase [Noviherbaspirillum denitrificans]|uniref:dTDP-4-dehydrorhamnose 3,5-epimerase n=1 Tax=Noviherbaspirillum denitrificans TaxID=1968433 RepID=A0A254TFI3_9BURK|nr:dTDP-4-dehydrorhamnose 3,5-epimerase [Noviherbaspirillum denitrificans]OWW21305.1 dTDP-4-dehydrorhamnose 3,5-epimerase [Noviherbaspirillum denitrificans]
MSRFLVTETPLAGLRLIQRQQFSDSRGFLSRLFCADALLAAGWDKPIVQINHTCTLRQGTVRGMHYQLPPHAEMKLVTCLRGEIWDVALDLRAGSPTFLQWHAERLSADNHCSLLIPEGFAHGFQALSDDVELLYCHSAAYAPDAERGLHALDERLAIDWPLPVCELSEKDAAQSRVDGKFDGVRV